MMTSPPFLYARDTFVTLLKPRTLRRLTVILPQNEVLLDKGEGLWSFNVSEKNIDSVTIEHVIIVC